MLQTKQKTSTENKSQRQRCLLVRVRDIFSKLHHISSNDDMSEPFPVQTTYIAFHEGNLLVENLPNFVVN